MAPGGGKPRTKIVCTVGPSSREAGTLKRMADAGMDLARVNTGHCDIDEMREYIQVVKKLKSEKGRRVGVMLDLQGPRLRVGSIKGSNVELHPGREFVISTKQKRGDAECVSVSYPDLPGDVKPGDAVLMDDGLIRMYVKDVAETEILCDVVEGGTLLQGKGINFPDSNLRLSAFTERDRRYLEAGLEAGIDWVAQSFVRTPDDVWELKEAIRSLGGQVPVMAKVEKREAVEKIDSILEIADGIMVARGDLGVEMNPEDVPLVQKELTAKALRATRPVLIATQMLESMVDHSRPTRAEASDVANAILDGTDAVMLSAETAIGAYPVESVEMISRVAARAEEAIDYGRLLEDRGRWAHRSVADAIGFSACKIAADLRADVIIPVTRSGYTAMVVARNRPRARIVAVSPNREVVKRMSLVWDVSVLVMPATGDNLWQTARHVARVCAQNGFVASGDLVVITGGFLEEEAGTTNVVHVHTVE
ncbi:MAG: pyruvate kinase [Actinobacteria bacterium]|nr:pyruvate kinase [Actinomycetota bacterium]MCG2818088.1 pyruvate kinase [Actinomycetes bacterium]MBU4218341.1 pyruvate kinase [Actinomycetota bacterium]MBU4359073.1 pyruvate kinase [Actinomycetota bacterium]MBU4391188.1 pyruvate kinase [Actinomycetota bacterium]